VVTLKRLAFLVAGGALLLLLNAAPVLADGGPHVISINDGTSGITADSCAGCHRAHTAQAPLLLTEEEPALCLTCHGTTGNGATTDVMNGIQYSVGSTAPRGGVVLGALRAGGFEKARIGSGSASRLAYLSFGAVRQVPGVPVLGVGANVTSAHLDVNATTPAASTVWGNGALDSGAGGTTTMLCTGCHNPHGNGSYRILNPIPEAHDGTMTAAASPITVQDAPLPATGDARNYTVLQKKGTEGTDSTYLLYASQIGGYNATDGDYMHRRVPWNATATGTYSYDAPNGKPTTFSVELNRWCAQCHSRYLAEDITAGQPYETDSGDDLFTYRHGTLANGVSRGTACTTCHVAHGSNAAMTGDYSSDAEYPDGSTSASSRLLKIDNRGTCQACHDPTGTITDGTLINGPGPTVP
jgi:predicted CXXCH cytochrome family protein